MKKFIRTWGIGVLASAFFWTVPVYAETETAGSSLKEEQMSEKAIELYSEEKEKLTGEWKQNKEGWWYYEYSNGTSPKISWRKIDGKWYYFNSKGYWIDDNTYEEGTLKGIDVSAWQAEVDWEAVKNDGIEFAMIRLGYNTNNLDKYYQRNMKEAEKVQIPVGVYYYSKATNEEEMASVYGCGIHDYANEKYQKNYDYPEEWFDETDKIDKWISDNEVYLYKWMYDLILNHKSEVLKFGEI